MSLLDLKVSYGDLLVHGNRRGSDRIQLWRTDDFSNVASVMDPWAKMGGGVCAVDPINKLLVSGTWTGGLTCFDYRSRKVLWSRPDILGIQTVEISSAFPGSVFVVANPPQEFWQNYQIPEPSGVLELDIETGKVKWRSVEGFGVLVHPSQPLIILTGCSNVAKLSIAELMQGGADSTHQILNGSRDVLGVFPAAGFPIVDVAFGEDKFAVAEGSFGVRIMDLCGNLITRYLPKRRTPNCIEAAFTGSSLLVVDSWEATYLTHIDPSSGLVLSEYERGRHDRLCFFEKGTHFIDQAGVVCQSSDGSPVGTLEGV